MITHVSIGVRDIDRSKRFYDATLEPLGYKCLRAARSLSGYGYGRDSIALWVVRAERPVPADEKVGSALLFYRCGRRRRRRVSRGGDCRRGSDHGAPGLRPIYAPDYDAAFIIDPDGYRIEAYYGPAET